MLLTIDAGNTNVVFAVFEGDVLIGQWRIATDARRTADEYGVWLLQIMAMSGINPEGIRAAIMACVIPQAMFDLKMLCRRYFNTELMVVSDPSVKLAVTVDIDAPSEVGADRLVNAHAAWVRHGTSLIVIDFGTATTFDVVSDKGAYIGGVIGPGINLSLDALHRAAARLPNVAIAHPGKVVGTNTVTAMQSGIYFGYIGLIEGIIARIRDEQGQKGMKVIATGGLAALYAKATPVIEHLEPDLTIMGLNDIYQRNLR